MVFRRSSVLLLFGVLFAGCLTGPPANLAPVEGFEVDRYLGKWYEIARLDHRFERGLSRVTAEYSLNEDGTIRVVNRGYNAATDEWRSIAGKAKFAGDRSVGSLKVSFFGPFYGGYHIIELDDDYQHAMVVGPTRNYLWILARSPELDEETYQQLVTRAKQLEFATDQLIRVVHDGDNASTQ